MKVVRKKGLTIIELLITIAVAIVLMLVAVVVVPSQLEKARDARRKADFQKIKTALYDYFFDGNCFPQELPECGERLASNGMTYLNDFPCDPNGEPYVYVITKKGAGKCSQWFRLFTNLEVESDPIIARIRCSQGCGPDCVYNYGIASTNTHVYQDCYLTYVCNPGGICQSFDNPWISECPIIFENDETCSDQCDNPDNRCANDSGKNVPWD